MDNKDLNQAPTSPTAPVEGTAFQADPIPSLTDPPSNKKSGLIWVVVGLVILILLLSGAYFYLTQSGNTGTSPSPKPAANQQESMADELSALDVEAEGSDFQEVDKDLQSL